MKHRKYACLRMDRIGDMVCLSPALQSLRNADPDAQIDVYCSAVNAPLLTHDPNVNNVHVVPFPPRRKTWRMTRYLARELRRHHYDVVLTFYSRSHTHLATALSKAPTRVGYAGKRFHSFMTHIAHVDGSTHEIDRNMKLLEAIGMSPTTRKPMVYTSEREDDVAERWLSEHAIGGPLVALHAGATAPGRRYAPPRLAEAVRNLMPDASYVIFEGPIDEEETRLLRARLPNAHVFKGSLLEMASLLKRCDLAVMNDSGPMHIAAAVRTPVVGIFGPSPIARWKPPGAHVVAVQAESHLIDDIAPADIAAAAQTLMTSMSR